MSRWTGEAVVGTQITEDRDNCCWSGYDLEGSHSPALNERAEGERNEIGLIMTRLELTLGILVNGGRRRVLGAVLRGGLVVTRLLLLLIKMGHIWTKSTRGDEGNERGGGRARVVRALLWALWKMAGIRSCG